MPISPRLRRTGPWLWAAVLLAALGLRLPAVTAGLPYQGYVDEGHVLHWVARMLRTGSWDPGRYLYPSLPFTAVAAAARLGTPAYRAVHGRPLTDDLSEFPAGDYDLLEPADLLILGRVLTLLASLGTVAVTGLLAARLGGEAAGLLAALLAAIVPALVIRGAVVAVDPWAACFVTAALLCAEGAVRGGRPYRSALLAGAMTGFAFASKYPAALVAVPVGAILLRVEGGWRARLRCLEIAAVAGLAAAAVAMPALVVHQREVFRDVARLSVAYADMHMGSYWDQAVRRAEWDQPLDRPEMGAVFLLWAALGWLAAVRDRRTRATVLAWTLYAGLTGLLVSRYPFRPFRNILPLVPLACVLAALLAAHLRERVARRIWVDAAAVLLAGLLLLPGSLAYARGRAGLVDSRVQAVDWVRERARAGDPVLVSEELAIVRGELARLGGGAVVLEQEEARKRLRRRGGFPFVVTGAFAGKAGIGLPTLLAEGGALERYELAARFGGETPGIGQWRGNRETVLIFRRTSVTSGAQQQEGGDGHGDQPQGEPGGQAGGDEAQLDAAGAVGHHDSQVGAVDGHPAQDRAVGPRLPSGGEGERAGEELLAGRGELHLDPSGTPAQHADR
jgi:hypothetical protein